MTAFLFRQCYRKTQQLFLFTRALSKKTSTSPTNHEITYALVQLQESDGTVRPSVSLSHLLASIDKSTHLVRLVSHHPPTVRIFTHLEDKTNNLQRKAELKARKNRRHVSTKEIRLTWLTSDQDFEHKMCLARKELEKGDVRLDFIFTPKRGVRSPTRFEMDAQMQKIVDAFGHVSNEWKERDFAGNRTARLFLQSTVRPPKTVPSKSELEELAKKELEKKEKSRRHLQKDREDEDEKTII